MKVFLTGATGFIGGRIANRLRERGDEVTALVRSVARAGDLEAAGCALVPGDLSDLASIRTGMEGCTAVIHSAAMYEVGVRAKDRPAMRATNVDGTANVLKAALDLSIPRTVYVSTINAFGNTEGEVVDENHLHKERYVSAYDETKHLAHKVAVDLIQNSGLPAIIVQPGSVYGPGDPSTTGLALRMFLDGKMPVKTLLGAGVNMLHVDDAAGGILLALDKGRLGQAYVLGGTIGRLEDEIVTAAKLTGKKAPRFAVPIWALKMLTPAWPLVGKVMGMPPNLAEMITAGHPDVTYWATDAKARDELGYAPRELEEGLRQTLEAEGYL